MNHDLSRNNDSSSSYDGRSTVQDDLTWLDFLRTAGGTVPNDHRPPQPTRTDSSERKRRHTGTEHHQRAHPHPFQTYHRTSNTSSTQVGNSRDTAIDLTTPPRSARPSSIIMQNNSTSSSAGRRDSEIVLPKWQPDHEATECPVCKSEFTFLYRRHHCRKCGRVVCATCSPHRITIPRQYIVQPPNPLLDDEANPFAAGINPALGGGEVVRVCNPCVPDPWTPEPNPAIGPRIPVAPNAAGDDAVGNISRMLSTNPRGLPRPLATRWDGTTRESDRTRTERYMNYTSDRGNRSQTFRDEPHPGRYPQRDLNTMASNRVTRPHATPTSQHASRSAGDVASHHDPRLRHPHRSTQSGGSSFPPPYVPTPPTIVGAPPGRRPYIPPQPQDRPRRATLAEGNMPRGPPDTPRREVREEDECPVCHIELPPAQAIREHHIDACLKSCYVPTEIPLPNAPHNAPQVARMRASSIRSHRMLVYVATEKDGIMEDGTAQECVICLEEFEEGQQMGRLECLCKFHKECIQGWWETKGHGSCPTHQLHD